MVRLGIVGGAAMYHGYAFAGLVNGLAPGQELPPDWPKYPRKLTDAQITVVWDEDADAARELARVFGIQKIASCIEEVPLHCEGVIITDDGTQQHSRHAPFFLRLGIATFIDKPFAPNFAAALSLAELAAKHDTPLMTGSALRYASETAAWRTNPEALGPIQLATAVGPNELFYYGIHPLELALSVLGGGVAAVQNIGTSNHDIVKLSYPDGRVLLLLVSREIGFRFELNLYGPKGAHRVQVQDATGFYTNQLNLVVKMVREAKSPVPVEEGLEVIRILEAAKSSLARGGELLYLQEDR